MIVLEQSISVGELKEMSKKMFGEQEHLWGINLFPDQFGTDSFIVFDSMINMRPSWGNHSRGVENAVVREKIHEIVRRLVKP